MVGNLGYLSELLPASVCVSTVYVCECPWGHRQSLLAI